MGEQQFGIEHKACAQIAISIKEVYEEGIKEIGIVIGGGNIFRGVQAQKFGFERTPADHIGMLATAINGLVLQQSLTALGLKSHVMSALDCQLITERYNWAKAVEYLEKGIILIFVGGTGSPYFTTDTAAALRASEIQAEILLKATKVDGVYSKDPKVNKEAVKYAKLSYAEVLTRKLNIMDAAAVALCRDNQIPICVFNLFEKGAMLKSVRKENGGSLIMGE